MWRVRRRLRRRVLRPRGHGRLGAVPQRVNLRRLLSHRPRSRERRRQSRPLLLWSHRPPHQPRQRLRRMITSRRHRPIADRPRVRRSGIAVRCALRPLVCQPAFPLRVLRRVSRPAAHPAALRGWLLRSDASSCRAGRHAARRVGRRAGRVPENAKRVPAIPAAEPSRRIAAKRRRSAGAK